jgi:hypothetical protein
MLRKTLQLTLIHPQQGRFGVRFNSDGQIEQHCHPHAPFVPLTTPSVAPSGQYLQGDFHEAFVTFVSPSGRVTFFPKPKTSLR